MESNYIIYLKKHSRLYSFHDVVQMFVQVVIKDTIKIPPNEFGKPHHAALLDEIHSKYANKVCKLWQFPNNLLLNSACVYWFVILV